MGLIVKTIPVLGQPYVVTDGSSSDTGERLNRFDNSVYRIMSSTSDMKTLEYPELIKSEFDKFLEQAERKQLTGESTPEFDAFDEYLGRFTENAGVIIPAETFRPVVNLGSNVTVNGDRLIYVRG